MLACETGSGKCSLPVHVITHEGRRTHLLRAKFDVDILFGTLRIGIVI